MGSLKADPGFLFQQEGPCGQGGNSILSCLDSWPPQTSVQGMCKVTANCSIIALINAPFLVASLKLSYAHSLLKHGTLSFGFNPKIKHFSRLNRQLWN